MAGVNQTILVGNSALSEPIKNNNGAIEGFVIDNPKDPDISVNLENLSLEGATQAENNRLRQSVYDAYSLGVKALPAFTPLAECVAKSATLVVHSDADKEGMYSRFVFLKNPEKSAGNGTQSSIPVVNIQGNPNLPDRVFPFEYEGIKHNVITEQQNKYYLGKDKLWYTTNPLELIAHEFAHGCKELQDLSAAGDLAYKASKLKGVSPDDEKRVIEFVNKTLLEPRGMPGRDLNSDTAEKPENARLGVYVPIDEKGVQKLMHGPIPVELKGYSLPTLKLIDGGLHGEVKSNQFDLPGQFGCLSQALELAGLCATTQSEVIARRIAENAAAHPVRNVLAPHYEADAIASLSSIF